MTDLIEKPIPYILHYRLHRVNFFEKYLYKAGFQIEILLTFENNSGIIDSMEYAELIPELNESIVRNVIREIGMDVDEDRIVDTVLKRYTLALK